MPYRSGEMTRVNHPDAPGTLLHFTGRTRGPNESVQPFAVGDPEQRLRSILVTGALRGAPTWGTRGPVLCMSELSDAALNAILLRGLNERGPYQPWGLVLHRGPMVALGAAPVWYARTADYNATANLPTQIADRRVHSNPEGNPDWSHEREWRICWGAVQVEYAWVRLSRDHIRAVIVAQPGWQPSPSPAWYSGVERWLWTGSALTRSGVL